MALLSQQEKQDIEDAIGDAESRTAGELVVAAVGRSAPYDFERLLFSGTWAIAIALLLAVFAPGMGISDILIVQVALGAMFWVLLGQAGVLRLLLPKRKAQRCVEARAMQLFAERGVHQTRDHSGLLILLSELEHQVVILGDCGIHEHVGTEGWSRHVDHVIAGIKSGRAGSAVVEVIDELAAVLAEKFPRRLDDINELSDGVIEEE
jgi:putative membrane protein